jgi:NADH-quinone oxidoreductase subunit G
MVTLRIDGQTVRAPAGTLVINAAKSAGIEIPAFCYYDGLTLQAACRMCLVEVENSPKLVTACTLPVAEGMVVRTDTEQVRQARKAMLEFILANHPLDCPVCDKGGECELQDLTFRFGSDVGRFTEMKVHVPEKQFSPVVYYDSPRCILCYRCVRVCKEGMGVAALGVSNRGVASEIIPNLGDHLECDECGMCIDICPVGALTSAAYRYKTRPWEMKHTGTACPHCADGCTTTLGVFNNRIMRGNNRERSGINGEFLCVKGRYAFDFATHPERLRSPLRKAGVGFVEVPWGQALAAVVERFKEVKSRGGKFGVVGSAHTTNEENYCLQELVRHGLGTNNIDHRRTGDVGALLAALSGRPEALATTADLYTSRAALIVANDLAQQHPLLAWQLRANWRHHQARVYLATPGPVREDDYAAASLRTEPGREVAALERLRDSLRAEPELVVLFGDAVRGEAVADLVSFCDSLGIPVKYVCLLDRANARGAMDMGLTPDLLPGYQPSGMHGLLLPEMLSEPDLDVLWVVGANPLKTAKLQANDVFVVVQDLFLTETARQADVVFPAACAYEKAGTITNTCGDVIELSRAVHAVGAKTDLEIFRWLARGLDFSLPEAIPDGVIQNLHKCEARGLACARTDLLLPAGDTLYTSGTLGRYSKMLCGLSEAPGGLYR